MPGSSNTAVQPKLHIKPDKWMLQIFCNPNHAIIMDFSCDENVDQL